MRISIITVCYNARSTILDACESVARQRGAEVEHIVVDGGSTDGTVEEIKKFECRIKSEVEKVGGGGGNLRGFSFKWVSERDRGMYDALNKGMRMATGDVIGILNADDRLDGEDVLAEVAAAFECGPHECVYGDIRFVRNEKTVRYYGAKRWKPWMFQWGKMPPHPGVYIRRECFAKCGGYKLSYYIAADYELLIRFMRKHAIRARYLNKCLVCMGLGGRSTKNWRSNFILNKEIVRANRENGYFCCLPMLVPKYFFKIWEFILPRLGL